MTPVSGAWRNPTFSMIKNRQRILISIALAGLFTAGASHAAQVVAPGIGDIFLGVRASDGQGSGTSYIVNIGNDATFRNAAAGVTISAGSYGADLEAIFGPNWHTRSDLFWGIFGTRNQANPVTYGSRQQSPVGTSSAGFAPQNLAARSSTNSQLVSVITAYASLQATANNPKAAEQTNGPASSSYSFQVATAGTTDFGSLSNWTTIEGNFGGGAAQTALDLFRYSGNTITGGNFVDLLGAFTINSAGALSFRAAERVQVVNASVTVNEDAGSAQITLKRFGLDLATPISATIAVTNGTAVAGTDFTLPSSLTVEFPANIDEVTVPISVINRTGFYGTRNFFVTLQSATGGYGINSPSTAIVTINDVTPDPGALAFTAASFAANVANSSVQITLTRTQAQAGAGSVAVDVSVTGGSLVNGTNYTFSSPTTVNFTGDATSASTTINLTTTVGGTITLALGNPTNFARLGTQSTATVNVAGIAGTLAFGSASYSFPESAGTVSIPVVRTVGSQGEVTVQVAATPGSATTPADFTLSANPLTVTLANGVSSVSVPVSLVADTVSKTNESFTLTLSSPGGGASLGAITTTTVRINEFDTKIPTVVLTTPAAGARVTTPSVSLTGTFSDDKGVDRVLVRLNGGPAATAALTGNANLTSGGFSRSLTPVAGPNTVTVQAVDATGNVSTIVSRAFTYVVTISLVVTKTGDGTLSPLLGVNLPGEVTNAEIGRGYTITATPARGRLFAGWTGAGVSTTAAELTTLTFTHQSGLSINANFVNNPFTSDVVGDFNGLIQHPTAASRSLASEGFITVNVTTTGSFSGTLRIDGTSTPLRGALNTSRVARYGATRTETLVIPRPGRSSLVVAFSVDLNPSGPKKLTGTVSQQSRTGTTPLASINADRASYRASSPVPSARQGTFNFVLPSQAQTNGLTAIDFPQGDGFGSVTISAAGLASFKGNLADGTAFTASAFLTNVPSGSDTLPFFAQPYANNGAVAGNVVIDPSQLDTDLSSPSILWFKPVLGGHYYPFGWLEGVTTTLSGAKYTVPTGQSVIPGLPPVNPVSGNATLAFSDGNLDEALIKDGNISTANLVTKVPVTNPTYALSVAPKTGDISGTFEHSDGSRPRYTGKIVQKGSNGGAYGYFLTVAPKKATGDGESGGVSLNHK